jgi:hypothetical protein
MAEGGSITFACDGAITLTSTITVTNDTVLDGTGHDIFISGGNRVRIFEVNTGLTFTIKSLIVGNGRVRGGCVGSIGFIPFDGLGGAISNAGTLQVFGFRQQPSYWQRWIRRM